MMAANLVGMADSGFESDYNALLLLWQGGKKVLEKATKDQLAKMVWEQLIQNYQSWKGK